MLIIAAIVLSVVFVSIYFFYAKKNLARRVILDAEKFKWLIMRQIACGSLHSAANTCDAIRGNIPLPKYTRCLLTDRRTDVDKIADGGQLEAEWLISRIKAVRVEGITMHLFSFGGLGTLLYADGLQTGWVIGPIVLAMLVMLFLTLAMRNQSAIAISGLRQTGAHLLEIGQAIEAARKS